MTNIYGDSAEGKGLQLKWNVVVTDFVTPRLATKGPPQPPPLGPTQASCKTLPTR